ncbi:Membrane-anchored ribosome-binding protein, inhibits growth in stationary phase, ElaB/YqjD/DUF883 family [Rhizobium sp. RU35A]|nr:Membrane-anchored ribosome-binding protein, inhibits growth in stationary phase, ElaB/YqjD/DUF883 family [Rhizobium sp. RU35A]
MEQKGAVSVDTVNEPVGQRPQRFVVPASGPTLFLKENAMSMNSPNDFPRSGSQADIELQLQQLREDIAALAKAVAAAGTNKAEDLKAKARRASSEAIDASAHVMDAARAQAASIEQDLERQIRTKPLQSVAIAAGLGFLFALLSRR